MMKTLQGEYWNLGLAQVRDLLSQFPYKFIGLAMRTTESYYLLGIWATDMGDKYPSAEITGIDLSPTQAEWVPPKSTSRSTI